MRNETHVSTINDYLTTQIAYENATNISKSILSCISMNFMYLNRNSVWCKLSSPDLESFSMNQNLNQC